jgi:protein lifeguard
LRPFEKVVLGVVCTIYTMESILIATAVTSILTLGLVAYAFCTKRDFTGAGPYLFMALWCLILYGFILALFPVLRSSIQTAYSLIGVVIFSFYLVYDVQLIIGGKHARFRFEVDDHMFAALNVYLDVINLFIRILQLFGRDR